MLWGCGMMYQWCYNHTAIFPVLMPWWLCFLCLLCERDPARSLEVDCVDQCVTTARDLSLPHCQEATVTKSVVSAWVKRSGPLLAPKLIWHVTPFFIRTHPLVIQRKAQYIDSCFLTLPFLGMTCSTHHAPDVSPLSCFLVPLEFRASAPGCFSKQIPWSGSQWSFDLECI